MSDGAHDPGDEDRRDDRCDLDHGARLSSAASSGLFLAVEHPTFGHALVATFGLTPAGEPVTVIGDRDAFESRRGRGSTALAEADLVAWLLTHRDELIRLARLGREAEVRRG